MGKTKNIQSIERAMSILELFEDGNREKSVKEIALKLDLSKSTVFGLINTLANLNYLHQNEDNLKYSLGLKVLALGSAVSQSNLLSKAANPHLQKLSFKFQETCLLAIEENGFVVYIDKTESSSSISINTRIGTKKDLFCTGVGKCFLAFMPKENADNIINLGLRKLTPNTIDNASDLEKELNSIRKRGFAFDNEEYELGISCVAVPVFSNSGKIIASISLTGPTARIREIDLTDLSESLKFTAKAISGDLNV
ncbi:MAG: IclR family transcriptional regulator [Lachnospiraceae bacterium]|nr:IclR family transcriptional regulator [Lachnospiraceae bacterium]